MPTDPPPRTLLHLPDPLRVLRPLSDLELDVSGDVFHPNFRSPDDCGVCRGSDRFRFYCYASVEYAAKVAQGKNPNPEQVFTYECDCRSQWIAHRYLSVHGIGLSYQSLTPRDIHSIQARVIYDNYRKDFDSNLAVGMGLVLVGSYGLGKSLVASLLVKDAIREGRAAFMATFPRLIDLYRQTWDDEAVSKWWDRRIKNAALLVVDDIGKETKTGAQQTTNLTRGLLDDLIRYRVGAHLSTLVTTNVRPDLFAASYGESIASLWGECSEIIPMGGDDARGLQRRRMLDEHRAGIVRPVMV